MSRKVGTRDKKPLYKKIIKLLKKHPEGMKAFEISQTLKENDMTTRNYIADLLEQQKLSVILNGKCQKLYRVVTDVKKSE